MPIPLGSQLGPYTVTNVLGAGGMGEVYRARDTRLGRDVAIKVLPSSTSTDAARLQRFEQEARAAAALNHPNILALFDIGQADSGPFIVSELLDGETLRAALDRGALPLRKALDYGAQIARGLAAAHDKGIVHRDLKPENVFVTGDGRVKILDFGLAKLMEAETAFAGSMLPTTPPPTTPGVVLGTVGYMAPEQVRGQQADHRADVFALGAVLYEMLTGRRAFARDTPVETMTAILKEELRDLTADTGSIPLSLQRVIGRYADGLSKDAMHVSPDDRFLLYRASTKNRNDIWVQPLDGVSKPYPYLESQHDENYGRFSPDGKWVAHTGDESGQAEVYVVPFPGPGGKWQVSTAGGSFPRWRGDGRELFFQSPDGTMMSVAVDGTTTAFRNEVPHPLFHPPVAVQPGYQYAVSDWTGLLKK